MELVANFTQKRVAAYKNTLGIVHAFKNDTLSLACSALGSSIIISSPFELRLLLDPRGFYS
jgi:hypothetical protein